MGRKGVLMGLLITAGVALLVALLVTDSSHREARREKTLLEQPIESLQQIEAREDTDALVHYIYAQRLFETGAAADARGPAARAVAALPKSEQTALAEKVYALSGYLAVEAGKDSEAEEFFQKAESLRHDGLFAALSAGIIALRQDRKADAIAALTRATRLDSTCIVAWKHLGTTYFLCGEMEEATEALRQATRLAPKDPTIHLQLGQALLQTKQFTEAETEARTVAALLPDNPYSVTFPARVMAYSARTPADYARATEALQAALSRRPEDDELRAELAGVYIRFNRLESARQELETILRHNPSISADCWYNLYKVCKRMGDNRAADTAYSRFRQVITLKRSGTELLKQVDLHPNDARLYLRLSNVLLRLGQKGQAYSALNHAASLAPNDPEIARALADAQTDLRAQQGATPNEGVPPQ